MVFEENIICLGHMKHMKKSQIHRMNVALGNVGNHRLRTMDALRRPRGLGGDFEFLPLKSPRNPITPIETTRVETLDPGLYTRL